MQTTVRDPLTDEILFGQLEHGGTVKIGLKDGTLTFAIEPTEQATTGGPSARTTEDAVSD